MDEMIIWLWTVSNRWLWRLLSRPSHCFRALKRISIIQRLE